MFKILTIILFSLIIYINCENDLIGISNKLALDLLNTFPKDGNNFFSPLSITTALLMVMNGAKNVTQQEFQQLFNLDEKSDIKVINENVRSVLQDIQTKDSQTLILKLANLMLVSNGFPLLKDYQQVMSEMFGSNVESVDFRNNSQQIIKNINDWVSEQTNTKIKSIFEENDTLPEDTPMVLLNAVYFKGIWKYVFDRKDTRKQKFFNFGNTNQSTMVDMMTNQRDIAVKHIKKLEATFFEMPFTDGSNMSMLIILPDQLDGLDSVTRKLSFKALNYTINSLSRKKVSSEKLIFPKFKLESKYDLKDYLQSLGLKSVFEDSADLSAINGEKTLKVGKAIHKAFIEVNEEGAEAAAVTKVVFALRSFRLNPTKVDHPFLFAIIDKRSSLIWFLGQIRNLS